MKYIVWFSGGIDSTFVAWYLKQQWHKVLLVNLKNTAEPNKCCSLPIQLFKIADFLNLPLEIIDVTKDFRKFVIEDFVENYTSGKTPNPCVNCNEKVRFKILNEIRKKYWFDYISTGHYIKNYEENDFYSFMISKDLKKDQTYMLYRLLKFSDILPYLRFPLWDFKKEVVKKILEENKIPVDTNKESQNICFIPDDDYPRFIKQNYNILVNPWKIIDKNWNYLWEHKWLIYYTVWQRKNLNISTWEKKYVLKLDWKTNTLVVWNNDDLFTTEVKLAENLILHYKFRNIDDIFKFGFKKLYWKIRYKASLVEINKISDKLIRFSQPVRAVTPGQHFVLYGEKAGKLITLWWAVID